MSISPKEIQEKLRSHFRLPTLEYKAPYKGKQGEHPAEIYFPGMGLMQQMELLKFFDNEKANIITSNLNFRGGCAQIIIKTEALREAFEKYAMSLLSLKERADLLLLPKNGGGPLHGITAKILQYPGQSATAPQVFSTAAVAVTTIPTATVTVTAPIETTTATTEATTTHAATAPVYK